MWLLRKIRRSLGQLFRLYSRLALKYLYKFAFKSNQDSSDSFDPPHPVDTELQIELMDIRLGNFFDKTEKELKIGYSLLIHNRYEYLKDCLASLFSNQYEDYDITFFLIDDGSTDQRVSILLSTMVDKYPNLNIKVIQAKKTLSTSGAVTNRAIRIMLEDDEYDVIGFGDPDTIYHPDWLNVSIKLFSWLHYNYKKTKVGMVSSYNSKNREFHQWENLQKWPLGNFIPKKQMGWPSIFILPEFIKDVGAFHEMPNDETLFTKRIQELGYSNFSTEFSYLEHVGQVSVLNNYRPVAVAQADHSDKLISYGWGKEIYKYQNYSIQRDLRMNVLPSESEIPLDVIIPLHTKDMKTLPRCIEGVRENLRHPIASITILSQASSEIQQIASSLGINWFDETKILDTRKSYNDLVNGNFERSGWLYQQMLKLSVDVIGSEEHKLVLDADNVFIRPQALVSEDRIYQPMSRNYYGKYFETYTRILDEEPINHTSFISHFMVFKVPHLVQLKKDIELISRSNWIDAIYASLDLTDPSCFSEFELYSHYVQSRYQSNYEPIVYKMLDLPPKKLRSLKELQKEYSEVYSIGFQQWMK